MSCKVIYLNCLELLIINYNNMLEKNNFTNELYKKVNIDTH